LLQKASHRKELHDLKTSTKEKNFYVWFEISRKIDPTMCKDRHKWISGLKKMSDTNLKISKQNKIPRLLIEDFTT
jgi:hypothetical protein